MDNLPTLKTYVVKVDGLDKSLDKDSVKLLFERYGEIFSVEVRKPMNSPNAVGYVNFSSKLDAEKAAAHMNGTIIRNSVIKTSSYSQSRSDHRHLTDCRHMQNCSPKDDKVYYFNSWISQWPLLLEMDSLKVKEIKKKFCIRFFFFFELSGYDNLTFFFLLVFPVCVKTVHHLFRKLLA